MFAVWGENDLVPFVTKYKMSLCYDHNIWGPFQWKMGIASYHGSPIILESLCSFKTVITVLGLSSVNEVLMYKHVRAPVISCFDTQIHLYVHLQKSRKKKRKHIIFAYMDFSPTSTLFLLNSFEWH